MDVIQKLDGELARWTGKRNEFSESLERAKAAQQAAQEAREKLLLAARAEGDTDAQAKLDAATAALNAAALEVADCSKLIEQVDGKLAELAQARQAASLATNRDEAKRLAGERMQVAAEIQRRLEELMPHIKQWSELCTQSCRLDAAVGLPTRKHQRHMTAARDAAAWLVAQLSPADTNLYRPEPWRRVPFTELEGAVLKDLLPTEPTPTPATKPKRRAA